MITRESGEKSAPFTPDIPKYFIKRKPPIIVRLDEPRPYRWPYEPIPCSNPEDIENYYRYERYGDYWREDGLDVLTMFGRHLPNPQTIDIEDLKDVLISSGVRNVILSGNSATAYEYFEQIKANERTGKNPFPPIRSHSINLGKPSHQKEPLFDCLEDGFEHNSFYLNDSVRRATTKQLMGVNTGAFYTPLDLVYVAGYIYQMKEKVGVCMVVGPEENGICPIQNNDITLPGFQKAFSDNGPRIGLMQKGIDTQGAVGIPYKWLTHVIDCDRGLIRLQAKESSEQIKAIARHAAPEIPLQASFVVGVGNAPQEVFKEVINHSLYLGDSELRSYSFATEALSDYVVDLDRAGLLRNRRPIFNGYSITSFSMGDRVLDYERESRKVIKLPTHEIADSAFSRRIDNHTALLQVISATLYGEGSTENIGFHPYAGLGGFRSFAQDSIVSEGSKRIVMVPAVTKEGISRIEPYLRPGHHAAVTGGGDLTFVSEYGVARVGYTTVDQRARLMIAIADPRHRQKLEEAYRKGMMENGDPGYFQT